MASTAEELASQAEQLQSTIDFFKIDDSAQIAMNKTAISMEAVQEKAHVQVVAETAPKPLEAGRPAGIALDLGTGGNVGDGKDDEFEKY